MNLLILSVSVFITAWVIRAKGVLNPGSLFASIAALHATFFYIAGILEWRPAFFSNWWHFKLDLASAGSGVLAIYLIEVLVGAVAVIGISRARKPPLSPTMPITRVRHGRLTGFDITVLMMAMALWIICVAHAMVVDWGQLWQHDIYLSVRDAESVNVRVVGLKEFHTFAPQLGIILTVGAICFALRTNPIFGALLGIPAGYCMVLTAANSSRLLSGYFGAIVLVAICAKDLGKPVRTSVVVACGAIGLVAYMLMLSLRLNAVTLRPGVLCGHFGIGPLLDSLMRGAFLDGEAIFLVLLTLFGSGFQLSSMLLNDAMEYPLRYKLLSFLPTPSFVDGFNVVKDKHQLQPSPSAGYSAVSETFAFGWIWFLFYLTMVFIVIRQSCRVLVACPSLVTAFVTTALLTAIAYMQFYPIRNSIKLFLLVVILNLVWSRIDSAHRKKRVLHNPSENRVFT